MEPPEQVETNPWVDMHVAVPEGEEQYVEAVGKLHEDRLDGQSGDGMPPEPDGGLNGPPQRVQLVRMRTLSRLLEQPSRRSFWTPGGLHARIRGS